ncbi:MAG: GNAT family protein [Parvularculaceae bacterium]
MLGLDFVKGVNKPPCIIHDAVKLRMAEPPDYPAWFRLREESRAHLTRWEPDWSEKDASYEAFKLRLRSQEREVRLGAALPLLLFREADNTLLGAVNLSEIRHQALCSATLGYWIGATYLRRGYAFSGVSAVLGYAFDTLGLNRIEAACQPGNQASRNLLAKAGFREEGLARELLFINGAWRDHLRLAITARDGRRIAIQP